MPTEKFVNQDLTTREKDVLRAYREHVDKYGAPPTLRALAETVGIVHSAVGYMLKRLHMKGYMQEKTVKTVTTTAVRLRLSSKGKKVAL